MAKQTCALVPMVLTSDGVLEQSKTFTDLQTLIKSIMKSNNRQRFLSTIDSLIDEGLLPSIEDFRSRYEGESTNDDIIKSRIVLKFLYSIGETRGLIEATGSPVQYSPNELLSMFLALSDNNPLVIQLGRSLNISDYDVLTAFNPVNNISGNFTGAELNDLSKILYSLYNEFKTNSNFRTQIQNYYLAKTGSKKRFKLDRIDSLTINDLRTVLKYAFEYRTEEVISTESISRSHHKDNYLQDVLNDLNTSKSVIFNKFLKYLKDTYGIDKYQTRSEKYLVDESKSEDNQIDSTEDIVSNWDELEKERVDRKNTLSSFVKSQLSVIIGKHNFKTKNNTNNYIPVPMDINTLWNKLINQHMYDMTFDQFKTTLERLSVIDADFIPIYEQFKEVADKQKDANSDTRAFVEAYMAGIGLCVIPVNILSIDEDYKASVYQLNREALSWKTHMDRFESVIETNIEFKLYKIETLTDKINKLKNLSNSDDFGMRLKYQMDLINYLGLSVSRNALLQHYRNNITVEEFGKIDNLIISVSNNLINWIKGDSNGHNSNGYLTQLAKIASYDFNSYSNLSYLDVQGKLNYAPQYDSFLTKFVRGFMTRTGVNTEYIKHIFKPYLSDQTLEYDNILYYDETTGLGIFDKNGEVHENFIKAVESGKMFNISAFNGIQFGDTKLKYKDVQGELYKYVETTLNLLGQYLFLTSDSPRSYMLSVQHIPIAGLFNDTRSKVIYDIRTLEVGINKRNVEKNVNDAIYILWGDTYGRTNNIIPENGSRSIRGLSNVVEIDVYKHYSINKESKEHLIDADFESFKEDFDKRVKPAIETALNAKKTLFISNESLVHLGESAPKIYDYIQNYLQELKNHNDIGLITDEAINFDHPIVHALRKLVLSDLNKFNKAGSYVFNLEDNSDELKRLHNVKYYGKKGNIFNEKGIPEGRAFQFLNITFKGINLPQFIADLNNINVSEVYKSLIANAKGETDFNQNLLPTATYNGLSYIDLFIQEYIKWNANENVNSYANIADQLVNNNITIEGSSQSGLFDTFIQEKIIEVHNQKLIAYINKNKLNNVEEIKDTVKEFLYNKAKEEVTSNVNPITSDAFRLGILQVLLNHTIYNSSINAIFTGDLEEYKNTIDLNKRISQIIRNGYGGQTTTSERKIVVMEDLNFASNILSKMEGVVDPNIINAYKRITINDSQSFITDKGLEKYLRSVGRWHSSEPLYKYITELRDKTKPFNPLTYEKLVEQLKLFGTARRRRGDFYRGLKGTPDADFFNNEIDSVQVKDSTIVLFETTTRGTALGELYDKMVEKEIDQISPISAVKVSGIIPIKLHNDNAGLNVKALDSLNEDHILYMLDSDFVIQQDIKADMLDKTVTLGNQLVKQIMQGLKKSDRIYKVKDRTYTGSELFKEFQHLLETNVKEDALELLYELGAYDEKGMLSRDVNGNIQINQYNLVKLLKKIVDDETDSILLQEALTLTEEGVSKLPLSSSIIRGKLDKILASLFTKRVINKSLPGFHAPIRADVWTADNRLITHKELYSPTKESEKTYDEIIDELNKNGAIYYRDSFLEKCKKEGRSLELRADYIEDGNYYHAEVLVSPWMKEFYSTIGTEQNLNGKTVYIVDINKLPREACQMVGIRIPTEGKQSMVVFEVVGFINSGATQAIFPQSLVSRTGWDFDIDSIYAYYRSIKFNNETQSYEIIEWDSNDSLSENINKKIYKNLEHDLFYKPTPDFINFANPQFHNLLVTTLKSIAPDLTPIADKSVLQRLSSFTNKKNIKRLFNYYEIIRGSINEYYSLIKEGYPTNDSAIEYIEGLLQDVYTNIKKFNNTLSKILSDIKNEPIRLDFTESNKRFIITHLENIKNNFDNLVKGVEDIENKVSEKFDIETGALNSKLNDYEKNSRKARDNRILDILESVLSNPAHRNDVDKPNATDHILAVSRRENEAWDYDMGVLNPNNLLEKILLNNMSMASTVLKGHSVNFDTLLATLSTLHAKLPEPIVHKIHIDDLVIPDGFTKEDMFIYKTDRKTNKKVIAGLSPEYSEFLNKQYGTDMGNNGKVKSRFKFNAKDQSITVYDYWINNNSSDTCTDISGKSISLQMNEFTSAILDVLKESLGFNLNIYTLSVARTMSMGVTIEQYNGQPNRFSRCMAFIHQPSIVDITNSMEVHKIDDPYYNLEKAIRDVKTKYGKLIIAKYLDLFNQGVIEKVESYNDILKIKLTDKNLIVSASILREIAEVSAKKSERNIQSLTQRSATQSTRELLSNIKHRDNQTLDFLIRQLQAVLEFETLSKVSTTMVDTSFILKTESKVDSFQKTDQKDLKLAEHYYPSSVICKKVNTNYNNGLDFIKNKSQDVIKDFYTLGSVEFMKKYQPTDPETNDLIPIITYTDLKYFRTNWIAANTIESRKLIVDNMNISYAQPQSLKIVSADEFNGVDVISAIFSDTSDIFDNLELEDSAYPLIQSRYKYGHKLMSEAFRKTFITRNRDLINTVISYIYGNRKFISDKDYKYLMDSITDYLISTKSKYPLLIPTDKYDILTLIGGIKNKEISKTQKETIAYFNKAKLDSISTEDFVKYTKLSVWQQIQIIKTNPKLRAYINMAEFKGDNIFNYLTLKDRTSNRTYDRIRLQKDENDSNLTNNITDSIRIMWNSKIPFIAHTIRQLMMYTYVIEGFNYGYNISKYVPVSILTEQIKNETYDSYLDKAGLRDITKNLYKYGENLRLIEQDVLSDNLSQDYIFELMVHLSRSRIEYSNKLLTDKQKDQRFKSHPLQATIGYLMDEEDNVAIRTYQDETGNSQQFFIESEGRLINSEYYNDIYVSDRKGHIYKRYPVISTMDEVNPNHRLFVYFPVNPLLKNETSLHTNDDTLSILPDYKIGTKASIIDANGELQHVNITDFIELVAHEYVDPFKKAMDKISTNEIDYISETPNSSNTDEYTDYNTDGIEESEDQKHDTPQAVTSNVVEEAPFAKDVTNKYDFKVQTKKSSLSDAVNQVRHQSNNTIFIGTNKQTFLSNLHKNDLQVDINKSPIDEAVRINKKLQKGTIYINGDLFSDLDMDNTLVRQWVFNFINNLKYINKTISGINTIVNDGIGVIVANTAPELPHNNVNIYESENVLFAKIIKTSIESDKYTANLNQNQAIAFESLKLMNKIRTVLERNQIGDMDDFRSIIYKYRQGDLDLFEEESDLTNLDKSLSELEELNQLVYDLIINELETKIKSQNYAEIRDNYSAVLDYKNTLNNLSKLCKHFGTYLNLKEIDINDTEYALTTEDYNENGELNETGLEKEQNFHNVYDKINTKIHNLQSLSKSAAAIHGEVLNKMKDVYTWYVIDTSRNPKFVTAFSKIKDYLAKHNYSLEGFDITSVELTEEEWLQIQSILYGLDKDISKIQKLLDSAFVTGVPLIDTLGKIWDEYNYKAKRFVQSKMEELETALEEFDPNLLKDSKARIRLMEKFINDEGDFIGVYNTSGLNESIKNLIGESIGIIKSKLVSETGIITESSANEVIQLLKNVIERYNGKHSWKITPLTKEKTEEHQNKLATLSSYEQTIYMQQENLITIQQVQASDYQVVPVLFKIDFSNTPISDEYANLSEKEKNLLVKIKGIVQNIIKNYDLNWTYRYGKQDDIVPYIPQATLSAAFKSFVSVPMIKKDSYFTDIDGTRRYKLEATTLKLPHFIPSFKIPKQYVNESNENYEKRLLEEFDKWFDKNNKLKDYQKPTDKDGIYKYNERVATENKKEKRKHMTLDILDIVKGCAQELSNLRAINNWEVDNQMIREIMNYSDGTKPSAMSILKNASAQLDAMEKRILNVSKYNNNMDVAAGVLMRYTSITYMYFNVTAGITNLLKGVTDMIVESASGSFVESKQLLTKGIKDIMGVSLKYLKDLHSSKTDNLLVAIIKDFDDIYQDTRDVTSSDTASSMWTKALNQMNATGYATNNIPEFIMQYGMALAATESHRVVKGENISAIMSFDDFYNDGLEKLLYKVLTAEQTNAYELFKEAFDENIAKYEKKHNKEYLWSHNYASEFLKQCYSSLSKDQQKEIVQSRKADKKVQKEIFDKLPTLRSQMELKDGKLHIKSESLLTERDLAQFKARVKQVNQSLHGIYNRLDRNSLEDDAITAPFMQFRKWMKANFNRYFGRRFGRMFYNEQLGSYEVPIYLPVFDMARSQAEAFKNQLSENKTAIDIIKGIGAYLQAGFKWLNNIRFYYNSLTLQEQIACVKYAKHVASVAFAFLSTLLVQAFKGDDDEEENTAYTYLAYTATTYYQQVIEPVPVIGWMTTIEQMTNNLFAGQKVIIAAGNLTSLCIQSIFTDEELVYDRGIYKDENKIKVALFKVAPVLRQINKHNHLQSTMSYYNMYNPLSFTFDGLRSALNPKAEDNDNE